MGLIRTLVYVGIIGGIFAYSQTKDSLDNLPLPDVELPSSLTSNDIMKSSVLAESIAELKNHGVMEGVVGMMGEQHDIRGSVNEVVMMAGNNDIQKLIQDTVDELESSSRKNSQ